MRGRKYGHIFTKMLAWMLVLVVLCTSVPMDGMRVYAEEDVNLIDENSDMLEDNFSESEEQNTKEESVTTNIVEELISEESDESLEEDRDFLSTTIDACFATKDAPDEGRFGTSSEVAPTISVYNKYIMDECFGDVFVQISPSSNAKNYYFYTSDSLNGSYEFQFMETADYVEAYSWKAIISTPIDPKTGNNKVIYVKVVMEDNAGNYTGYSNIDTNGNAGVWESTNESSYDFSGIPYKDICFLDENNNVIEDALILHVGESKRIHLGLVDASGYIQDMDEMDLDYFEEGMEHYKLKYQGSWIVTHPNDGDYERMYGCYAPIGASAGSIWRYYGDKSGSTVKYEITGDNYYGVAGWFTGVSVSSSDYYIQMVLDSEEYGIFIKRLKVNVENAESGAIYQKCPIDSVITSSEECDNAFRDLVVSREAGPLIISSNVGLNLNNVFDIYRERDDIKPWEGDYLQWTKGDPESVVSSFTDYDVQEIDYYGEKYYALFNSVRFITSVEQEALVTQKIKELLAPGGDLFSASQSNSDEIKAKAAYDYVVKHVSGFVKPNNSEYDRTRPINHTAYGALINGYGTCQAFALLYTRLTRELGVPSKLIMGLDAAAHTYNIVKIDDYWYYVDCSASKWKKTYNEFSRAIEMAMFRSPMFVENYISKIKDYVKPNANGKIVVLNNNEEPLEAFDSLSDAREYVFDALYNDLQKISPDIFENYETVDNALDDLHYTLRFDSDIKHESLGMDYYESHVQKIQEESYNKPALYAYYDLAKSVSIDLNGHTYTCPDLAPSGTYFSAAEIKNGTIKLGTGQYEIGRIYLWAWRGMTLDNVKIIGVPKNGKGVNVSFTGITMNDNCSISNIENVTIEGEGSHSYYKNESNTIYASISGVKTLEIKGKK